MIAYVINLDSRPDRMESFNKNEFPFPIERVSGVVANCGEDGCTYSHMRLLTKQKEFPFAVFEDDCVLMHPWSMVEDAMKQLPDDWDALWLGANLRNPLKRYSKNLFRLRTAYATHAIIYNSKKIVDFILANHNTPSGTNFDMFYGKVVQERFKCYITCPMIANQRVGYSDITKKSVDYYDELNEIYEKQTR